MNVNGSISEKNDMITRRNYLSIASVITLVFIGSLLLIQRSKADQLDLGQYHYPNLSPQDRCQFSYFNWYETKDVTLELTSEQSGMITIRSLNSEILFQTYLEGGIKEDISLNIPDELDKVVVEYSSGRDIIYLDDLKVAYTL